MGNVKGTTLTFLKKKLESGGPKLEQPFMAKLSPDMAKVYRTLVHAKWYPIETYVQLMQPAAEVIHPNDRLAGLHEIGYEMALDNLSGIYRVLLHLMTIPGLLSQVAVLWKTYHDTGNACVDKTGDSHSTIFTVRNYPALPAVFREVLTGYIVGCLELMKAKNVLVKQEQSNDVAADDWVWACRWD